MNQNDKSASPYWNDREKYAGQRQRDILKLYAKPNNRIDDPYALDQMFQFRDLDDDAVKFLSDDQRKMLEIIGSGKDENPFVGNYTFPETKNEEEHEENETPEKEDKKDPEEP